MSKTTATVYLSDIGTIRRAWSGTVTDGEARDSRANEFLAECRERVAAGGHYGLSDLELAGDWLARIDADPDCDIDSLIVSEVVA